MHVADLYEATYCMHFPSQLVERISKLHMLMIAPSYYALSTNHQKSSNGGVPSELADPSLRYPRLAHTLLNFLKNAPQATEMEGLFSFIVDLVIVFMARSGYSEPLISLLRAFMFEHSLASDPGFESDLIAKYFDKLIPSINQYFEVRLISSSTSQRVENSLFHSALK